MGTGITITINSIDITAYCKIETLRIEEVGTQDVATAYFEAEDHTGTITISGKHTVDIRPTGGAAATILFAGEVGRLVKGQRGVTKTWEVNCQDNNVLLDERTLVTASYAAATADSAIIDDLFTNYRSDIDSTTEVDTINASMEAIEFEEMTLRECLDAICAITGGRYYVDYQKQLHYFNVETGNTASFDLSTSPDFSSTYPFGGFSLVEDSTRLITHVRVIGEDAEGWYPATPDYSADERHALVHDRSALTSAAIEDVGTAVYNRYSSDRQTYRLYTEQDGLRAGQSIGLVNATWSIDSTFWIRELKMVVLDKAGDKRRYHLVLNDESPSPARMARHRQMDTSAQAEIDVTLSARGWGHDLAFSASDDDTVAWTGGTITLADGHTTYSIDAGNTGNMAALTYIYLDTDVSLTVLQTTTTAATAIGKYKILIAVAAQSGEAGKDATFQVFGGHGGVGVFITADNIAANTITANEISGNTITAAEIAADTITAAEIAAATITGTEIAANTITADKLSIGEMLFDYGDDLLLWGASMKIEDIGGTEYWIGTRGQRASISGALHLEQGRWRGTQAIVIEDGTTNECNNPSFETNTTNWASLSAGTIARTGDDACWGDYSLRCTSGGGAAYVQAAYSGGVTAFDSTEDYVLSASYRLEDVPPGGDVYLMAYWTGGAHAAALTTENTGPSLAGGWHRVAAVLSPDYADRTGVTFYIRIYGVTADGQTFLLDGFQIEQDELAHTSYCDGSLGTGYAWVGAAHASASTRTATDVDPSSYVASVSGVDTLSFRLVVQMPYDYDATLRGATSNNILLGIRGADNNNRIFLFHDASDGKLKVYINGGTRITPASATSFAAGDWLDIVVTLDFSSDEYYLYIDGAQVGSSTATLSAPTLTAWRIGASYAGTVQCGVTFSECVVINRVLTEAECEQLYNLQRPTVDVGATDKPGIYIFDGQFRIASSQAGNRIEITPDEIAGYDSSGTKQFYLQSTDGKAIAGAGVVEIDADGIDIALTTSESDVRSYKMNDSGTVVGGVYGFLTANDHYIRLLSKSVAAKNSYLTCGAYAPATYVAQADLVATSGATSINLSIKADSDAGTTAFGTLTGATYFNFLTCDVYAKTFSTNSGTHKWEFFGYTAAAIVSTDGYVKIEINGVEYRLMKGTFA